MRLVRDPIPEKFVKECENSNCKCIFAYNQEDIEDIPFYDSRLTNEFRKKLNDITFNGDNRVSWRFIIPGSISKHRIIYTDKKDLVENYGIDPDKRSVRVAVCPICHTAHPHCSGSYNYYNRQVIDEL